MCMAQIESMTPPNAGKDVEQQERPCSAGGKAEWHSYPGRQFLRKWNEPFLAHDSAIMLLGVYLEELKNLSAQSNLHKDVSSNFIHNCPNLEAIRMSFSWWMDK